jgi:chromate transporter
MRPPAAAPGEVPARCRQPGRRGQLRQLARLYLKLGTIAFGGPAAHIAMMEDEVVRRRGWLERDEFLDLVGVSSLIPGPSSTEVAIFVGYARAGLPGLLVAGACFILPAMLITAALAWTYVRFGTLPAVRGVLYGIKPVVIAIVLQALWRLGRTAVKSWLLALVGAGCAAAAALGANLPLVLLGGGLVTAAAHGLERRGGRGDRAPLALLPLAAAPAAPLLGAPAAHPGLWPLFRVFLEIGCVVFGSGYVLLAFLRAELVAGRHWLTESQLLDSVVVGQVTPGPVFTTATFVGYVLRGPAGALAATLGIFLPAFVLVAIAGPLVRRLRRSGLAGAILDGLDVASLALMAVVSWQLGRAALVDAATVLIAAAGLALLLWRHVNSAWLVLAGALAGLAWGR